MLGWDSTWRFRRSAGPRSGGHVAPVRHVRQGLCSSYHDATRCEPEKARQYEGRVTITEIEKTCGAGCGYGGDGHRIDARLLPGARRRP